MVSASTWLAREVKRLLRKGEMTSRSSILVLNADLYQAGVMSTCLVEAGYEVQTVGSGGLGLEMVQQESPDLVVVDWELPDLGGMEVIRRLRLGEQTVRLPIILTGKDMDDRDRVAGLESGADLCLTEALQPRVFVARVKALLRRFSRE